MKTIIAATDFTASSVNACRYAAMLCQKLNCKLTLFNLFEAPVIHSNMGLYGISYTSVRKESEKKSEKLLAQIKEEFPKIKVGYFVTSGSFKQALEELTTKHLVEATVMGLKAKDKISKFIYGSHGVNIAGKLSSPVIIVPEAYKTHSLSKVLLAVDNNEKLYKSTLLGLERFMRITKARPEVLHIRTEDEIFIPMQKEIKLNGKTFPVITKPAKDIIDGIKKFSKDDKADLVAIISKNHSPLYNLFSEPNTKKIAFNVKVPVMAIHE